MAGERFYLGTDRIWHRKGWASVRPGGVAVNPETPGGQTAMLQVADLDLQTGALPQSGPLLADTYFGACPVDGAASGLAGATSVTTKWGAGASVRQYLGSGGIGVGPYVPAAASVTHTSYKLADGGITDAAVNAGTYDSQIAALAARTPDGHVLEFNHESDNDGLSATDRTARIKAKNRLYDVVKANAPGVLVAHTFTGGFWASYGSDTTRDLWMPTSRGDLIGLDFDGVHDSTGPTYDMDCADEIANVSRYLTKYASNGWQGWTVPEFGTSRQPWDTTGNTRAAWLDAQADKLAAAGAYMVCVFDFNTSAHNLTNDYNRLLSGTPEFTLWRSRVASNPTV